MTSLMKAASVTGPISVAVSKSVLDLHPINFVYPGDGLGEGYFECPCNLCDTQRYISPAGVA